MEVLDLHLVSANMLLVQLYSIRMAPQVQQHNIWSTQRWSGIFTKYYGILSGRKPQVFDKQWHSVSILTAALNKNSTMNKGII